MTSNPAQTGYSRVFMIAGRARPDHIPSYQAMTKAGAVSQAFGDVTKIEAPDPDNYGAFIEVGRIKGATERATVQLMGRYASDTASELLELARNGCAADVQVHFGACSDPRSFDTFTKALILEDALITNYGTEDLGALGSDEQAKIDETVDISAKDIYEVLPLTFAERAGTIVTNEVLDGVICDTKSCGDCEDESSGCEKIYTITKAAGGSAGTPPDLVYSLDGGANWYAHDIDTLAAAEDPNAIACLGDYLVVVSEDSGSLHYVLKSTVTATDDPAWTEVSTGLVALKGPLAMDSTGNYAFIVGEGGYIYGTSDPTAGVTVLDAGVATVDDLLDVHALSDTFAVAVGNNGAIVKTENGSTWTLITAPTGAGIHYNAIWVKSEREWWIGTNTGLLYYTLDGGDNFALRSFPGSGAGAIHDIKFATNSVGYLSHATAAPLGRILRTFNGGQSWVVLPEGIGSLPVNDRFNFVAPCTYDANFIVAGGLADNAADGIIVVGED
jgi:hypothetical protein